MVKDLTKGHVGKSIFAFALPMLLGNIFQQFYNIVDSIIVGNYLGKEALSAVGASFPIFFALISLVIGLGSGAGTLIAQNFGAKNMTNVKLAVDTIFAVIFSTSIIISALGIIFIDNIFDIIKLPADIVPQARIYLVIILLGLISGFGYNGISSVLRNMGDSKTPLYFLIISTISNVILDLVFVIVFKWGIAGVAIATVISQTGAFLTGIIYINKKHDFLKINFFRLQCDKKMFLDSLRIGLPSGMQNMFVAVGMMAIFRIVNDFDTNVIAAYSVAGRIDSFAVIPAMNFSMALTSFTGQNIGAGRFDRVRKGLLQTWLMSSVFSIIISVIIYFFGDAIMSVFTEDKSVIKTGYEYLVIVGSFYIVFSTMFVLNAVFRGAGSTLIPMFITLLSLWLIRIPISHYLALDYGEKGIWWGLPVSWGFGMIVSFIYFMTGKWKRRNLVQ